MAKLNGRFIIGIITLVLALLITVMAIAKTYYTIPAEVQSCSDDIDEMHEENSADHDMFEKRDMELDNKIQELRLDTVEMKSDLKYLRTDMIEQKVLSREILSEIKELRK